MSFHLKKDKSTYGTIHRNSKALVLHLKLFEPLHEKTCLCHMLTTKAQSDQHLYCSLSRKYNISSFYIQNFKLLASMAVQASLSLTSSKTSKTGFLMTRLIWLTRRFIVSEAVINRLKDFQGLSYIHSQ